MVERVFVESRSPVENFLHSIREKQHPSLDTLDKRREAIWLFSHHLSHNVAELKVKRNLFSHDFFCVGKWEDASEFPISLAVWDTAKEGHFSRLIHNTESWAVQPGGSELMGEQHPGLWIYLKVCRSYKRCHRLLWESHPWATDMPYLCISPNSP